MQQEREFWLALAVIRHFFYMCLSINILSWWIKGRLQIYASASILDPKVINIYFYLNVGGAATLPAPPVCLPMLIGCGKTINTSVTVEM